VSAPKRPRAKRPPRKVWAVFNQERGSTVANFDTKREADKFALNYGHGRYRVVGPYVLAERVRER
jgi:hypothetical protein